jgi:Protein of unknown function (DUF3168)
MEPTMPSAAWSLQKALFAALAADAPLLALLRGPHIYDDVPQASAFPYITFDPSTARDWSTASDTGSEHSITLSVWSQAKGRAQVHEIMAAARDALHGQPLTLDGHRLINLRHEFSEPRRSADGETYLGTARFRAVTEPI